MTPLELIARTFALERGIPVAGNEHGFSAKHGLLSLTYFNRNNYLLIKKTFPALENKEESKIYVSEKNRILKMKILYGCLQDYIALLDNTNHTFCQYTKEALAHYLGEDIEPEKMISEEVAPTDYVGIALLLDCFYPY
ncbi:MAG: hypothetical protein Q8R47_05035 [Nanoarchaeota archaeon]|nr:hypothetical protein [Nanoarchaeota archaeon]